MSAREGEPPPAAPIAFIDSGVGGLGVLAAARRLLPGVPLIYYADQQNFPYGQRTLEEVGKLALEAVRFLRPFGTRVVVVACNTASAAALKALRATYPDLAFVGMEPAVKPAAAATRTGRVGVLATAATFQGDLFASLVDRYARHVEVFTAACPEIVEAVESGAADDPALAAALVHKLAPMRAGGVDQIVLGCTHFPFAREAIAAAAGPGVELIDPAPAVARRVAQVAGAAGAAGAAGGADRPGGGVGAIGIAGASASAMYVTTGRSGGFDRVAGRLLGEPVESREAASFDRFPGKDGRA